MARYSPQPPRKRRTREHVLADLSANHLEKIALQCGYAVERIKQDYGLDLAVFTFDDSGCLEGGVLWFQLKATDSLQFTRDGAALALRIDRRDLLAWIAEANPVILVLFWIESQNARSPAAGTSAFAGLHGKTVTVRIPIANVLTAQVMHDFAREKAMIRSK